MAAVVYSLHQVSPAPLQGKREAPVTYTCNSRSGGFPEDRAALPDLAERESVGDHPVPTAGTGDSTVPCEGETGARELDNQNARECDARAEGRLEERRRIARELHDTLLQSFQASLIHMQFARNILFGHPEQAAEALDGAMKVAAAAVAEGRDAIQGLRCQATDQGDLGKALILAAEELAHAREPKEPAVRFRLIVEGQQGPLKSFVQDEIYQIGRELLRNAFRHAQASQVEAEVRYQRPRVCLYVRDNGIGIDPEVLASGGRDGHWGFRGIRERTERIGARLEFWTKKGAGTEVRLTVPASQAYAAARGAAR